MTKLLTLIESMSMLGVSWLSDKREENMNDAMILASWLAGEFSSFKQTLDNPRIHPHIRIFFRPLPFEFFEGIGFYSEQVYDYDPWHPHHQNVHRIFAQGDNVFVENYALKDKDLYTGSGSDLEILKTITPESIELRNGCAIIFQREGDKFVGQVEPGNKCLIPRKDGRMTYLKSEVEVTENTWVSRDTGFDVDTDEKVWGSTTGLLKFEKVQNFAHELPKNCQIK